MATGALLLIRLNTEKFTSIAYPRTGTNFLAGAKAGDRHHRAVLRAKFFHAQRDRALQQSRVREGLRPLSFWPPMRLAGSDALMSHGKR